jgi:4-diphosphocytidyl-2-C-methyl-D-erythritol kinase
MHLHKVIPAGAGLGGGSSDAAHALRLLNQVCNLQLENEQLQRYAAQLGSDCSFFLQNRAMIGTGRGEQLQPVEISLAGWNIVILKPQIHVSTAEAYAHVKPAIPQNPLSEVLSLPVDQWKNRLINDFEYTVFEKYPVISMLKQRLYTLGASYASMTGSGAAVFGLFEKSVVLPTEWRALPHWQGVLS